jgi:hypothetical protein
MKCCGIGIAKKEKKEAKKRKKYLYYNNRGCGYCG